MRIWPAGKLPELQHVANTNFCDIGFALDADGKRLIIISCLDNLGKGAAGPGDPESQSDAWHRGADRLAMRIVIKFAGALLEDAAATQSLSRHVASLARHGHEILVIHGGGRLFTATLKRLGIESKFVAGLRVTDRETRDVAVMVFGGF